MDKILICVCTKRRPDMLRSCVDTLQKLVQPRSARVEILVVDNDYMKSAASTVIAFASGAYPVHYHSEPSVGLSNARNAALAKATELEADWIAFIDDDEMASEDWLLGLYEAAIANKAEVATGCVQFVYPASAPKWAKVNWKRKPLAEGAVLSLAVTCSVLASMKLFRSNGQGLGLEFDERLNATGGEDVDLFSRAHAAGIKIVHTNTGVAFEIVHPNRMTPRAILRKQFNFGMEQSLMWVIGSPSAKQLAKIIKRIVKFGFSGTVGASISPVTILFGREKWAAFTLARGKELALAFGMLAGLFGSRGDYYR